MAGAGAGAGRGAASGAGARGVSAFLVPAGRPGLRGEHLDMIVPHPIGRLVFDGVPVGPGDLLGERDRGFAVAMGALARFRPSAAPSAAGCATSRRSGTCSPRWRPAPRRPGPLVYSAAEAYDAGAPDIAARAATAKLFATETARFVVDSAVRIHGARAPRRGHLLEVLYREVRAPRIYEGASEVQRTTIAKELYKG